uniref:Small ribosomal subunit protein uS17 n=1 Tax=Oncorhynchus mykiss TaxID=8022 RepID=A0A8K9UZD8_ONCMY
MVFLAYEVLTTLPNGNTDATERAYQKQPTIFQNKKRVLVGEGGFKTPREAIDGIYIDKKCPFTGNVSIRGRILSGVVTKMKMQRTIVIRRDYLHYIQDLCHTVEPFQPLFLACVFSRQAVSNNWLIVPFLLQGWLSLTVALKLQFY